MNNSPTPGSDTSTPLYYEICGSGPPVVLVHGLGASIYSWRYFREPLQTDYTLYLIDLKGCGKSPKPRDNRYSIQEQVGLIYQLIVEHDLKDLALVGNSYGGGVSLLLSLMLCKKEPNRLSKLILIDSAGYNESLPWYVKLLRTPVLGWLVLTVSPAKLLAKSVLDYCYYNDSLITKEQVLQYAAPLEMTNGKYALRKIAQQAIPDNIDELTKHYKDISVPTLILWGDKDEVIPLKIGHKLDAVIPKSKLVILKNTGHIPQEETPAETIPLVKDFLKNPVT
jgi:pimeloyl-ACP methyl ester carboxylesterase